MSSSLLDQARSLLQSQAKVPALLALALLPLAESAQASAVAASDLQVTYSHGDFYNNSGYFNNYRTAPTSDLHNTVNPDGSPKLYGSISATTEDFYQHNVRVRDGEEYDFTYYPDSGLVMVWGGEFTGTKPPSAGDFLDIHYDFNFGSPNLGQNGANYTIWSYLGNSPISYGLGYNQGTQQIHSGEAHVTGDTTSHSLQSWETDAEHFYWQVAISVEGGFTQFGRSAEGFRYALSPELHLTVPNNSIDVQYHHYTNPQQDPVPSTDLPEPGSLALMMGGLASLAWRLRRRT